MALHGPGVSWLHVAALQLAACSRGMATVARLQGRRPYFVPDEPKAFEKWDALWRRKKPRTPTSIPWERVPLTSEQRKELAGAAAEAGLPPSLTRNVLRAVRAGHAPYQPEKLRAHIAGLYELERQIPGLEAERLLERSCRILDKPPAAVARQVKFIETLLKESRCKETGPLLTGASDWAVLAPMVLAARLGAVDELWSVQLGCSPPPRALLHSAPLRPLAAQSTRKNATHMRVVSRRFGRDGAAEVYRRWPELLRYRRQVVARNAQRLERVFGDAEAGGREVAAALVRAQPRLLSRDAGSLAPKLQLLGRMVAPAAGAAEAAAGSSSSSSRGLDDNAQPAATGQQEQQEAAVAAETGQEGTSESQMGVLGTINADSPSSITSSSSSSKASKAAAAQAAGTALLLRSPSLAFKSMKNLKAKAALMASALGLDPPQLASLLQGAPNLLTRSQQALGDSAKALAGARPDSPLSMDRSKVVEAVLAFPRLLGYSAGAITARLELLEALRGVSDSWDAKVRETTTVPGALASVLASRKGVLLRLQWVVSARARVAPPDVTLLELLDMDEESWGDYFPAYSRDAAEAASARKMTAPAGGVSVAW